MALDTVYFFIGEHTAYALTKVPFYAQLCIVCPLLKLSNRIISAFLLTYTFGTRIYISPPFMLTLAPNVELAIQPMNKAH
jgi:hypothetical protein